MLFSKPNPEYDALLEAGEGGTTKAPAAQGVTGKGALKVLGVVALCVASAALGFKGGVALSATSTDLKIAASPKSNVALSATSTDLKIAAPSTDSEIAASSSETLIHAQPYYWLTCTHYPTCDQTGSEAFIATDGTGAENYATASFTPDEYTPNGYHFKLPPSGAVYINLQCDIPQWCDDTNKCDITAPYPEANSHIWCWESSASGNHFTWYCENNNKNNHHTLSVEKFTCLPQVEDTTSTDTAVSASSTDTTSESDTTSTDSAVSASSTDATSTGSKEYQPIQDEAYYWLTCAHDDWCYQTGTTAFVATDGTGAGGEDYATASFTPDEFTSNGYHFKLPPLGAVWLNMQCVWGDHVDPDYPCITGPTPEHNSDINCELNYYGQDTQQYYCYNKNEKNHHTLSVQKFKCYPYDDESGDDHMKTCSNGDD